MFCRVFCLPPLIYASIVEHRWRRANGVRPRQGSDAEEALHVVTQPGNVLSPYEETLAPRYHYNSSFAGMAIYGGVRGDTMPMEKAEVLPGEGAMHEIAPAYTPRESMGRSLVVQDAGGPYELYDSSSFLPNDLPPGDFSLISLVSVAMELYCEEEILICGG